MFGRGKYEHTPRYYPHHLTAPTGYVRVRIFLFGELYVIDWEGTDVNKVAVEFAQFLENQADEITDLPLGWKLLPHVHREESGVTVIRVNAVEGFEVIIDGS